MDNKMATVRVHVFNGNNLDNIFDVSNVRVYQDILTQLVNYGMESGALYFLDGREVNYVTTSIPGVEVKYVYNMEEPVNVHVFNGDEYVAGYELNGMKMYQDIITELIRQKLRSGRIYSIVEDEGELIQGPEVDYNAVIVPGTEVNYIMAKGNDHNDFFDHKSLNQVSSNGTNVIPFTAKLPYRDEILNQMTFRDIYNYGIAAGAPLNSSIILGFLNYTGSIVNLDDTLIREPLFSQGATLIPPSP